MNKINIMLLKHGIGISVILMLIRKFDYTSNNADL